MRSPRGHGRAPGRPPAAGLIRPAAVGAAVVLLLVGCRTAGEESATAPATSSVATSAEAPLPGPQPLPVEQVTVTRVTIPAIDVDAAPVEGLGLLPDGSLAAPADFDQVGWFAAGTVPGDRGPAVVAGHVDSVAGPAVFYRLRELAPGDEVTVGLSDGRAVVFRVTGSLQVPKDDFPTEEVYGPTPDVELRLITCSGEFDRSVRSYEDNTVVFATQV